MNHKVTIKSLDELRDFAESLTRTCNGGEVFLLSGELGAGKTTFVTMFAKALGSNDSVTSPTFVLRNEYGIGGRTLLHIDLYRLESGNVKDFEFLELVGDATTISCIEWPERILDIEALPGKKITLRFEPLGESERLIAIEEI